MLVRAVVFTVTCIGAFGSDAMAERPRERERSPLERLRDRDAPLRWRRSRREFLPQELQVKPLEEVLDGEPLDSEIPIPAGWKSVGSESEEVVEVTADADAESSVSSPQLETPGAEASPPSNPASNARPYPVAESALTVPRSIVENATTGASPTIQEVKESDVIVEREDSLLTPVPDPYLDEVPIPPNSLIESDTPRIAESFPLLNDDETGQTLMLPALPAEDGIKVASVPKDGKTVGGSIVDGDNLDVFRSIKEIEPYFDYSPIQKSGDQTQQRYPKVEELPPEGSTDRMFADMFYHWHASNLHHNPLYFEDVSLERYGHAYPPLVQPFVSVGKAGLQLAGLPYQMALSPVHNEEYVLGYYRPGDPAPHLRYRIPYNKKAAITASAAYTGLIFLFP